MLDSFVAKGRHLVLGNNNNNIYDNNDNNMDYVTLPTAEERV